MLAELFAEVEIERWDAPLLELPDREPCATVWSERASRPTAPHSARSPSRRLSRSQNGEPCCSRAGAEMGAAEETTCPGCGVVLPAGPGLPQHPYIGASPECWAKFGELLAREYEHPAYFHVHQVTVDAYAVQHSGKPERRTIQSVALHLMTLAMVLEDGLDPRQGPWLHKRMVRAEGFERLQPPSNGGPADRTPRTPSQDAPGA
jgi:hypothetical protein